MARFVSVAKADELEEGRGKHVSVDGLEIALFKIEGKIYAIQQECPHQGGPLSEGELNEIFITCPWHGMVYDIGTGKATPDAWDHNLRAKTFKVKVEGSDVKVEVQ